MPANTAPIFILSPEVFLCKINAANTASDGSGTLTLLMTATTFGGRIDFIRFMSAQATPTSSSLKRFNVFVTDATGANPLLIEEGLMVLITRSTTVVGAKTEITFTNGLNLKAGQAVYVSQSIYAGVQDQTHVTARGGQY